MMGSTLGTHGVTADGPGKGTKSRGEKTIRYARSHGTEIVVRKVRTTKRYGWNIPLQLSDRNRPSLDVRVMRLIGPPSSP